MLYNKNLLGILSLFLLLQFFKSGDAMAQHDNETAVANALSYLIEEENYLELIKVKYPSLKDSAEATEKHFDSTFFKSRQELEKLYINNLEDFKAKMIERSSNYFNTIQPTEKQAQDFLSRAKSKTRGKIDLPILETLLAYEYKDNPIEEMKAGFTKTYCTKGHLKSKGINFSITLPESWRQIENTGLHPSQKFICSNGFGSESLLLMVKDIKTQKGKPLSGKEIDQFFESENLTTLLPAGSKIISTKKMSVDKYAGEQVVYQHMVHHHIKTQVDTYLTMINNKMVIMQFTLGGLFDEPLDSRFAKLLPVYNAIANSMVFDANCK